MNSENCQKIKLLKLLELLRQETDEEHPMTTNEICERLAAMHISCDRRTLAKDIRMLNEQGYEVESCAVGKAKGFFIADRSFSVPELKMLIDAVQGSNLITDKKTEELIAKIAALGGSKRAEILKGNIIHFNRCKHTNERIYYTIDALEEALRRKKKVTIVYFHLDENRRKVYRSENGIHTVEPIALVYNNDNYYLTCYNPVKDRNFNYRLDRIEQVTIEKEPISSAARIRSRNVQKYNAQVFKMYGGEPQKVTLEFKAVVVEYIYDKFGIATNIFPCGNGNFGAEVEVQLSPTFWSWLFQFASSMRLTAPQSAIEQYQKQLKIAEAAYQTN